MLSFFRAFAKSWVAKVFLFVPLLIAFGLIFNVSDFLKPKVSDAVVTAGPRSLSEAEFKQRFDSYKKRFEQQQNRGEPIAIEEYIRQGVPNEMAEQFATSQSYGVWLGRIGLRPSETLIEAQIKKTPAFFNQFTGKFDKDQYLSLLNQNGMTEKQYLEQLSDEIANNHLAEGVFAGMHVPAAYIGLQSSLQRQRRDASWFLIDQKVAGIPGQPTDAQLQAYIKAHAQDLRQPEFRVMQLVLFSPQSVMNQVKVDPAELQKAYDFEKDSLSQAERRNFVQIPAPDAQTAAAIAQALKAGGDPSTVAKSRKLSPIVYQDKPKSAVADPAVAAAAFSLKPGEVSAPIHGSFGWAVVKIDSITPGHAVSLEEAKPQIEAQLRQKLAEAKTDELVQKFQDLRDKGVSMLDAARQLGLEVKTLPPLTKDGLAPNGQPLRTATGQPFMFPKSVLQSLYSLPKGGESPSPEETGNPNEYYSLRVAEVIPSQLPTLDKARAQLSDRWRMEEAGKLMKQKTDELMARLKKGESLAAVAASIGSKVETRADFGQISLSSREQIPAMLKQDPAALIVAQAFNGPVHVPYLVACDPYTHSENCIAVVRVDAVHPPLAVVAAKDVAAAQPRANIQLTEGLVQAVQASARAKLKAKVYKDKIPAALGVQAEGAPTGKGK
jgi:peptidyl-prolyl cis-trans isomerase D